MTNQDLLKLLCTELVFCRTEVFFGIREDTPIGDINPELAKALQDFAKKEGIE